MGSLQVEERFSEFYERWMGQLEDHTRLLLVAPREEEASIEAVVSKLTAHHKEYYTFKWASAQEDVLAFFTPPWLTPLENAYLWVTGWKPSMAFRLVDSLKKAQSAQGRRTHMQVTSSGAATAQNGSLAGMTEDQARKIDALRVKIKAEEQRVEREMERQQVGMADRKLVELARLESLVKKNGDPAAARQVHGLVEAALKGLLAGLEKVMKMADCVRLKTLKGVLDVLSPIQSADFLAATSMLQLQMRKWGRSRDKCCNGSSGSSNSSNRTVV